MASIYRPSHRYNGGYYNGYHRPYWNNYGNRYWRNPINRWNTGTLTGFTPPVNYNYYSTNPSYSTWYGNTPYTSNVSLGTRIRRFFNPNYNNYVYNPNFNPNINGNYNNLGNKRYVPLYGNGNGINGGGTVNNGYMGDSDQTSSGGATVTIID